MEDRRLSVTITLVLIIGIFTVMDFSVDMTRPVGAVTITVDDGGGADYTTIQAAIDAADDWDKVYVYEGTYYENLDINNRIVLQGENKYEVIVNGTNDDFTISIHTSGVKIKGLTIENGINSYAGISIPTGSNVIENNIIRSNNNGLTITGFGNTIRNNIFEHNEWGIFLSSVRYHNITHNLLRYNEIAIAAFDGANDNDITYNSLSNNQMYGIYFSSANANRVHHNNYLNNTNQAMQVSSNNIWDDGNGEGNHWDDYTGLDDGSGGRIAGDGVGDTGLPHYSIDNYPLMDQVNISAPLYGPIINTNKSKCYDFIQEAINDADSGNTILVTNGSYFGNIVIDKSVNLLGEDPEGTTIIGDGTTDVVRITTDGVSFSGFTVLNSGQEDQESGIKLDYANSCTVENNIVRLNYWGISLYYSTQNVIKNNHIHSNEASGIIVSYSDDNRIEGNNASSNDQQGITVRWDSYRNNIIRNNASNNYLGGIKIYYADENNFINNTVILNDGEGIYVYYSDRMNITDNTVILNDDEGIYIYNSDRMNITDNTIYSNSKNGIYIRDSHYNPMICNNTSINNSNGIYISDSRGSNISNNEVSLNKYSGISLYGTRECTISNNTISHNQDGIYQGGSWSNNLNNNTMIGNSIVIDGVLIHWNTHNIDMSNTVNGKPVYYLKNQTGGTVPPGAGQIILANSKYINIIGQTISNTSIAIELGYSHYNNITFNNVHNNIYGILMEGNSQLNLIIANNISYNDYGLYFESTSNNNIINNLISHNSICGFYISDYPWGNNIYHNNFVNNMIDASDFSDWDNQWDNGYPSGGNYWFNYSSPDELHGPNQNISGSDGICDQHYEIDADSIDNYPLMESYVDTKPPEVTLQSPVNNSIIQPGIELEFLINEEDLYFTSYYSIDGQPFLPFHEPYDISTEMWVEGKHKIVINTTDLIGNSNSSLFYITIDSTYPTIHLDSPRNNSIIGGGLNLSYSIYDAFLSEVSYCINGKGNITLIGPYNISTEGWKGGIYNISIKVVDIAGNINTSWYIFTVDTTPPSIMIDPTLNHSVISVGEVIQFEIKSEDVDHVMFSLAGGVYNIVEPPYLINTTEWEDGAYVVSIKAYDIFGNEAEIWFEITIDAIPPYIVATYPSNQSYAVKYNATISFLFSEIVNKENVENYVTIYPYVDMDLEWDSSGTTLLIPFELNYLYDDTIYNITIDGRISDINGNPMGSDFILVFSTSFLLMDTDGDGIPNYDDDDDDNDGYLDEKDAFPLYPDEWLDTDNDGIGNNIDHDDDNDGHDDDFDAYPLDPDKWKKEADSYDSNPILIMVLVAIVAFIITFFLLKKKRDGRSEELTAVEVVDEEN